MKTLTEQEKELEWEINKKIDYASPDAWIFINRLIKLKIKKAKTDWEINSHLKSFQHQRKKQ